VSRMDREGYGLNAVRSSLNSESECECERPLAPLSPSLI